MNQHQQIRHHLHQLETQLQDAGLWQQHPPSQQAFASREPFCVDTMTPLQWLQWVLLPRMHDLLDSQGPLPTSFAVAPYYEVALEGEIPHRARLLHLLNQLDAQFGDTQ